LPRELVSVAKACSYRAYAEVASLLPQFPYREEEFQYRRSETQLWKRGQDHAVSGDVFGEQSEFLVKGQVLGLRGVVAFANIAPAGVFCIVRESSR